MFGSRVVFPDGSTFPVITSVKRRLELGESSADALALVEDLCPEEAPPTPDYKVRKRKRTNLTVAQRCCLDREFTVNERPKTSVYGQIAVKLDLPKKVVRRWFKSRRARERDLPAKAVSFTPLSLTNKIDSSQLHREHFRNALFQTVTSPTHHQAPVDHRKTESFPLQYSPAETEDCFVVPTPTIKSEPTVLRAASADLVIVCPFSDCIKRELSDIQQRHLCCAINNSSSYCSYDSRSTKDNSVFSRQI